MEFEDAKALSIVSLLLEYPGGLQILLGEKPPPDTQETYYIFESCTQYSHHLGVRISGGRHLPIAERMAVIFDIFNSAVNDLGGWKAVTDGTNEMKRAYSSRWEIIKDYYSTDSVDLQRIDMTTIDKLVTKYKKTRNMIRLLVKEFPETLSRKIAWRHYEKTVINARRRPQAADRTQGG